MGAPLMAFRILTPLFYAPVAGLCLAYLISLFY